MTRGRCGAAVACGLALTAAAIAASGEAGDASRPAGDASRPAGDVTLPSVYQYALGNAAPEGAFTLPQRLAAGRGGEVLLTDAASHRVQVHDASGAFVRSWGSFGTAEGKFSFPDGIAVDAAGRVVVADRGNERVQVFDGTGRMLDVWREYDDPEHPGRARPLRPTDVAAAPGGDILVADWYDSRVLRFSASGTLVSSWGGGGTEPGRFVGLTGLAVGDDRRVFTVEWGSDRVQVFDLDGTLLDVWRPGQGTDIDARGDRVYVAGSKLFGVRVLDSSGGLVAEIPLAAGEGAGPEDIASARSVAAGTDGVLSVLEARAAGIPDRVVRFDGAPSFVGAWSGGAPSAGLIQPADVAIDRDGRVLVADPTHGQVQRFAADGTAVEVFPGASGSGASEVPGRSDDQRVAEPIAVAGGIEGDVYVSDRAARRVLRLDGSGAVQGVLGSGDGDGLGEFGEMGPGDLAFTHSASSQPLLLYVADPGNTRVQAFDLAGVAQFAFGAAGDATDEFCSGCVGHVATAPGGAVYVTETSALQRVLAHDWSGEHAFTFEGHLGEDSRFAPLTGIAYGPPDRLYLADPRLRVQAFSAQGQHLGDWETVDSRAGMRIAPSAVAADAKGLVYVADAYGGMVHVFGPTEPAGFRRELYRNPSLAGWPGDVGTVDEARLDWGDGPPGEGWPSDGSSARLYGRLAFPPGRSTLVVDVQGGCRVWVGEDLLVDEWQAHAGVHEHVFTEPPLDQRALIEFVDESGPASLAVQVRPGGATATSMATAPVTVTSTPTDSATATFTPWASATPNGDRRPVCLPLLVNR